MSDAETIDIMTVLFPYAVITAIESELPQYSIIFIASHKHKKVYGQKFSYTSGFQVGEHAFILKWCLLDYTHNRLCTLSKTEDIS